MGTGNKCELCGEYGSDGDPVVEYLDGEAHIACAEDEGWEN
jgi:hypothetical protein